MSSDVAPFEWLEFVQESAYGTPVASPVVYPTSSPNASYVRLAGANRFDMRTHPVLRKVPFGGGWATPGYAVSDRFETTGNLSMELCYSQAGLVLPWAISRINVGQTTPWVTTEPPGDLASCTIYHGTMRSDGSVRKRWYRGVKVTTANVTCSGETGLMMLKLGLRAQGANATGSDPTSLATAPADTAFPTDSVLFYQAASGILAASSALAFVEGVTLDITNVLDAHYYSSQYLTLDRLRGRTAKTDLDLLYTASPEWRTLMEAVTSQQLSLAWTNTAHTITFTLQNNNLLTDVSDDLTPGKIYNQKISYEYQWDTTNGDLTVTVV